MFTMFNLLVKGQIITLWFLISTSTAILDDVVFLNMQCNSSVQFSCTYPDESNIKPFAFTLQRQWVNPEDVFYLHFGLKPRVSNPKLEGRIFVQHDTSNQRVNVTINDLQSYDIDLYICKFHYDLQSNFHSHVSKNMFFLFVRDFSLLSSEATDCSRSNHEPLLFALSAAAGLLFIILLILAAAYRSRRNKPSPQLTVPIYEEMSGAREKLKKNTEDATYAHPKKENPYIN
ncbi:cd7 antigen-like [Trichomycterus rosablanca]|uniref:cd7 antigen-like n=1 Tax=Trichomycterus rosablanca TaxID=2290929 RepID=UPI002F3533D1